MAQQQMGTVTVEGKPVAVPQEIIDAGVESIRMALFVDFPDIENADIQIVREASASAPAIVTSRSATVVKRSTPKG